MLLVLADADGAHPAFPYLPFSFLSFSFLFFSFLFFPFFSFLFLSFPLLFPIPPRRPDLTPAPAVLSRCQGVSRSVGVALTSVNWDRYGGTQGRWRAVGHTFVVPQMLATRVVEGGDWMGGLGGGENFCEFFMG